MKFQLGSKPRTTEEWEKIFTDRGALWIRTRGQPHIEVQCFSNGRQNHIVNYFNSQVLIGDDILIQIARDIILQRSGGPAWVPIYGANKLIGSESRGVPLFVNAVAQYIRELRGKGGNDLTFSLVKKNRKTGRPSLVGLPIKKGDKVIICDDAVFTGSTLSSMIDYVRDLGAEVLCIITIFNGARFDGIDGVPIHYLIKRAVVTFPKETCILCLNGSRVITHPRENWLELFEQ